jgi:hypothetical protein
MKSTILTAAIAIAACISIAESMPIQAQAPQATGEVTVQGNRLIRDGHP